MLLSEPPVTAYDVNFRLGNIPVRIHPGFLILPVIWGSNTGSGIGIVIFLLVFFVSILVHELGHALLMRYFGEDPRIVLYWSGGLAINDGGGPWRVSRRMRGRSQFEQILISFAGPAAGLMLALAILGVIKVMGAGIYASFHWIPVFEFDFQGTSAENNPYLQMALHFAFYISLYLNLFNLLPVYPMDGGQIARGVYLQLNPWQGLKYSLVLSLVVAVVVAILFWQNRAMVGAIFFAMFAIQNFQELQMLGTGGFGGRRPW